MDERWEEYKKITAECDRMFNEGMKLVRASQELQKQGFALLTAIGKESENVQPVQE